MEQRELSKSVSTLKNENSYLKKLISPLKSENTKLQKKIAHLEAKYITSQSRIKALEKLKIPQKTESLSDFEIARRIAFLLNKGGFEFVNGKAVQIRAPRDES